jgi:hypothetical protein
MRAAKRFETLGAEAATFARIRNTDAKAWWCFNVRSQAIGNIQLFKLLLAPT